MRILVTGGIGLVGSNLIRELEKEGQGFICVQSGCKPETDYDKTLKYYCCSKIDGGSSKT